MREHDLDNHISPQLAHTFVDLGQCIPGQPGVHMYAPQPAAAVVILGNALFSAQDPGVVAAVTPQIDVLLRADTHEQIHVSVDVSGAVDDVDAPIPKEVDGAREPRKGLPGPLMCHGRQLGPRLDRGRRVHWRGRPSVIFSEFAVSARRRRELDGAGSWEFVGVEQLWGVVWHGTMLQEVQGAGAHDEGRAGKIRGRADVVPVHMAEDNEIYFLLGLEECLIPILVADAPAKARAAVRIDDDRLSGSYMWSYCGGVA